MVTRYNVGGVRGGMQDFGEFFQSIARSIWRSISTLQPEALAVAAAAIVILLLLLRGSRRRRETPPPRNLGTALALALDGDLSETRRILESRLRHKSGVLAENVIALVAVLRQQGELQRARGLVEQLGRRLDDTWVRTLRVRLALDAGEITTAVTYVLQYPDIPVALGVAALSRAGQWSDALDFYRSRTSRRTRSSRIEADLLAGLALSLFRVGEGKQGTKTLKKALLRNSASRLARIAGARYHPEPKTRTALRSGLEGEWPWEFTESGETKPRVGASHVLREAREEVSAGRPEGAMHVLRTHLDSCPEDWGARRMYAELLLDHYPGELSRAQLAEVTELLVKSRGATSVCDECGLVVAVPLVICSRCDGLGTFVQVSAEHQEVPRYLGEHVGADLRHIW